jgi:hypothetical protein
MLTKACRTEAQLEHVVALVCLFDLFATRRGSTLLTLLCRALLSKVSHSSNLIYYLIYLLTLLCRALLRKVSNARYLLCFACCVFYYARYLLCCLLRALLTCFLLRALRLVYYARYLLCFAGFGGYIQEGIIPCKPLCFGESKNKK